VYCRRCRATGPPSVWRGGVRTPSPPSLRSRKTPDGAASAGPPGPAADPRPHRLLRKRRPRDAPDRAARRAPPPRRPSTSLPVVRRGLPLPTSLWPHLGILPVVPGVWTRSRLSHPTRRPFTTHWGAPCGSTCSVPFSSSRPFRKGRPGLPPPPGPFLVGYESFLATGGPGVGHPAATGSFVCPPPWPRLAGLPARAAPAKRVKLEQLLQATVHCPDRVPAGGRRHNHALGCGGGAPQLFPRPSPL